MARNPKSSPHLPFCSSKTRFDISGQKCAGISSGWPCLDRSSLDSRSHSVSAHRRDTVTSGSQITGRAGATALATLSNPFGAAFGQLVSSIPSGQRPLISRYGSVYICHCKFRQTERERERHHLTTITGNHRLNPFPLSPLQTANNPRAPASPQP